MEVRLVKANSPTFVHEFASTQSPNEIPIKIFFEERFPDLFFFALTMFCIIFNFPLFIAVTS